jgi:ABC-type branched-subunit amino acid transport system permease subunit
MTVAAKTRPVTTPPRGFRSSLNAFGTEHRSVSVMVGMLIVTLSMLVLPRFPPLSLIQNAGPWYDSFANAGVFVLLAMGLNVVIGMAGLLDLGYAAFFAIGAYTYAYSNSPYSGLDLPFYPMLFVGAGVAAVFGILLGAPTLRLRGDYLAIMTLGFGEIVPIVFLNLDQFTGGTNGIKAIYRPETLTLGPITLGPFSAISPLPYLFLMVLIVTFAMIFMYRLQDSRIGRSWNAIREDELAAAANGINTVTTKLLAFSLGRDDGRPGRRLQRVEAHDRLADQFLFTVSFTGAGDGHPRRHGQHLGCRRRRVHRLHDPGRGPEERQRVPRTGRRPGVRPGPGPRRPRQRPVRRVPVPPVRRHPRADDAVQPEGLFPSQRRRAELHVAEELGEGGDPEAAAEQPGTPELIT